MERIEEEECVMDKLFSAIRPPKLEDAGLEDCALPAESIMEAFSRAAASLKSRIVLPFSGAADGECGGCVHNPGPSNGQMSDKLFGAGEIVQPVWPVCGDGGKEVDHEGSTDEVVVFGAGGGMLDSGKVLVLGESGDEGEWRESGFGGKRGCTADGGVLPGETNGHTVDGDLDEDEEIKDRPRLIEDLI